MSNENNINKDTSNSISKYSNLVNNSTNIVLDGASQLNKLYENKLNEIDESTIDTSRIETAVDDEVINEETKTDKVDKIETKVDDYDEIQTSEDETKSIFNRSSRIKTVSNNNLDNETNNIKSKIKTNAKYKHKSTRRIATVIKGAKTINNLSNKIIKAGRSINTGLNEQSSKAFEEHSSRIMTRAIKKPVDKITNKATNIISKKASKVVTKASKKLAQKSKNIITKAMKVVNDLTIHIVRQILSMLPSIAPIIIIIIAIAYFCSFFGASMSEDTIKSYEDYMIAIQDEYDTTTIEAYNNGTIVEGAIEGKGFINWKAPLAIIQMLNAELTFDESEQKLLETFKTSGLYETITDSTYTYEKETETTNEDGTVTTTTETVTETKKIVTNASLDDYIDWCNNNFAVINEYKKSKNISYDSNQTSFTDEEIEQIELLYSSTAFFDLFSSTFQERYAYLSVSITDEDIQAIYNEFLANAGTRYLMDHSNLSYDTCMDYYDCSSWVIHCLAHCGIATIPDTTASGIYNNYCVPISVDDRQAGDLIFLKDTYDTGNPGGISHVGIYMGELTINGETAEWVIDTGSNPSGVKITKYQNGWWNSDTYFYSFGRLK